MAENNFQRVGSSSNAHVGREFEKRVLEYFSMEGIKLRKRFLLEIGVGKVKKSH